MRQIYAAILLVMVCNYNCVAKGNNHKKRLSFLDHIESEVRHYKCHHLSSDDLSKTQKTIRGKWQLVITNNSGVKDSTYDSFCGRLPVCENNKSVEFLSDHSCKVDSTYRSFKLSISEDSLHYSLILNNEMYQMQAVTHKIIELFWTRGTHSYQDERYREVTIILYRHRSPLKISSQGRGVILMD